MLMTKHQDREFLAQTVYLSGQAFIRCKFTDCTLVVRNIEFHLDGCHFEQCNWHLDVMLPWGNPDSLTPVEQLVAQLRKAQLQLPAELRKNVPQPMPDGPTTLQPGQQLDTVSRTVRTTSPAAPVDA